MTGGTSRLELTTTIRAPLTVCFDCARDIDLHLRSLASSGEQAIAGRTSGLIGDGEDVVWRARHFGVVHTHHSRITAFDRPRHFRDSMIAGRFRTFEHDHFFEAIDGGTRMRDVIEFASPLAWLGRLVDRLVMRRYLRRLIAERSVCIREAAEQRAGAASST